VESPQTLLAALALAVVEDLERKTRPAQAGHAKGFLPRIAPMKTNNLRRLVLLVV